MQQKTKTQKTNKTKSMTGQSAHACNHSTQKWLRQEDLSFKDSLDYIVRLSLKKTTKQKQKAVFQINETVKTCHVNYLKEKEDTNYQYQK